jgi:hypothetical protein
VRWVVHMKISALRPSTIAQPPRILVYSSPGTGKSTLLASSPTALVLQGEDGTNTIWATRIPSTKGSGFLPVDASDVTAMLRAVEDEPKGLPFTMLSIDTIDGIEGIFRDSVLRDAGVDTLEKVGKYGAGHSAIADKMRAMVAQLERIQAKHNMAIVLSAHARQGVVNADGEEFSLTVPTVGKQTWSLLNNWCNACLFLRMCQVVDKEGKRKLSGARELCTVAGNGFEAKNRYGFPPRIPLEAVNGWARIQEHLDAPSLYRTMVIELLKGTETDVARKTLAWFDAAGLHSLECKARYEAIVEGQKKKEQK